jgi:hypothetical protein
MSQVTLRQLPANLEKQIRRLARENRTSINKTIIRILSQSLGIEAGSSEQRNLDDLSGNWSDEEAREFEGNTRIFDSIDTEIWS